MNSRHKAHPGKLMVCLMIICLVLYRAVPLSAKDKPDYDAIGNQIARDAERKHIPGVAVVVANKDKVLFEGTYGNCDSIDTPFIMAP
ncbi:MAG: hypothetical protein QM296_01160 [Bacillota bacterium]|nr:hypothetical protein [Bacillota bacterium]